ncbi:hypothetical protein [Granulicella sibirica]|uniref:Uncharacterized protein n=1 Tax=Granulicella sibirica TaxID=2479048 RepID=A0A4Q0SXZ2_9BACT|nr:hypothetical protein [Granulicella sibirica]RXH56063.1 hypothetical protein GRAN_2920 [Granulicella sibirica]
MDDMLLGVAASVIFLCLVGLAFGAVIKSGADQSALAPLGLVVVFSLFALVYFTFAM